MIRRAIPALTLPALAVLAGCTVAGPRPGPGPVEAPAEAVGAEPVVRVGVLVGSEAVEVTGSGPVELVDAALSGDVETALDSPVVADPLRLYDFCPITDGSAALLFCWESVAHEYADDYAVVSGVGGATDTHVVHERADPTTMRGVVESSEIAYEMADRDPDDVDVAELHDMFTILEFLQSEDLGFFEKGEGWKAVEEGVTDRDGDLPINTSGGLKSKGHPLGASGVAQVYEIYKQVIGDAGPRQVEADVGLACNVGGFGNCVTTTILEGSA